MKTYESSAKTVEDAIAAGLEALGASISDVTIEVLNEGSKGLFGLFGSRQAKVRLTLQEQEEDLLAALTTENKPDVKPEREPKPARKPAPEKKPAEKKPAPKPEKAAEDAHQQAKQPKQQAESKPARQPKQPRADKPKAEPKPEQEKKPLPPQGSRQAH